MTQILATVQNRALPPLMPCGWQAQEETRRQAPASERDGHVVYDEARRGAESLFRISQLDGSGGGRVNRLCQLLTSARMIDSDHDH